MSSMEEMEKVVTQQERQAFSYRLVSISVRWKIRIAYLAGILLTAFLVILMVNLFQRKVSIQSAYEKVYLLRTSKTRLLETYFGRLSDRITGLSADPQMLDTETRLSESFMNIESDSYSTPAAESTGQIATLLEGYYSTEILPVFETRLAKKIPAGTLLTTDHRQQIMQYLYIAGNAKPWGSKQMLTKAADASAYSNLHGQIHPGMVKLAREAGISDILLVDYKSGYVVYSVKKNLDFASNLYDGPYKNTALGIAFKAAIGLPSAGSLKITDESIYLPALGKPTLFISAPLFSGNEMKGAIIFAVDAAALDKLLAMENDESGTVHGLKLYCAGYDLLYRSNDPDFVAQPVRYLLHLKRYAEDGMAYRRAGNLNTTAMVQRVDELAFADGVQGKEKMTGFRTATGQDVLCSYGPVDIPGLNWIMISQIDKASALKPAAKLTWYLCGITVLLVLLVYFFVHFLSGFLARRFAALGDFLHAIAKGERPEMLHAANGDEIDRSVEAANLLTDRITQASSFIDDLGKGNIDQDFALYGNEDRLGIALNNLKSSLAHNRDEENLRKREEEIRNWSSHGIALFNDILRTDNDNLDKLSLNIIRNIIQYLSANQGGIFMIDGEEGSKYLQLVAAYAFDRQKFLNKRIGIGEGLVGTCVLEKKTILLSKIPDNYIEITSGLGGARPGCLLIVPLKKDEEILGVVEIASFNPFQPHEVEFVEKLAESIASALITVRLHLQTSLYLERFQQQAEEMKAQDEELRQNIEELQTTHEQMERMKEEENDRNRKLMKEVEDNRKLVLKVLEQIPGKIFVKDHNGVLLLLNSEVAKVYNKTVDELIGTSDFDNHPLEDAKQYREKELEIIANGAQTYLQEETITGEKRFLKTTKMPFYLPHLDTTGLLGIQLDVTEFVNMESENKEKEQKLELNRKLLIDILDKVPAKVFLKDENGIFIVVNTAVAEIYNKRAEQVIGTSDYDNHPDEDVDSWRKQELEIMEKGETIYIHSETIGGKTRFLKTIKMPFRVATTGKNGLLGIQLDVTDLKLLESQVEKLKMDAEALRRNK
jgi:PAS domain S-box-containing protein